MLNKDHKVIIYAQDHFGGENAKTGIGFIRYGLATTVGIVDRKSAGKKANDIYNDLYPVPIYESIESAKKSHPEANVLLIGIAMSGGTFPLEWIPDIKKAISLKINIVNGLHDFLCDIPEVKNLASEKNVFIWDVRKSTRKFEIANARILDYPKTDVILTVGTDGAIGKMTVSLELTKSAKTMGKKAKFIATGQTGMMISGEGIPLDALVADFMAGAVEEEVVNAAKENNEILFVEGQGSILHPGWSGVTLSLIHGALPNKLILCHRAKREFIRNTKVKIESLRQFIKVYEEISLPLRKAKVLGVGLNTFGLTESEAKLEIKNAEDETGLPADDVIRFGGEKLLKACLS
jgi:uncharacterized NAD-dependent epimerase/dehydratase family protein